MCLQHHLARCSMNLFFLLIFLTFTINSPSQHRFPPLPWQRHAPSASPRHPSLAPSPQFPGPAVGSSAAPPCQERKARLERTCALASWPWADWSWDALELRMRDKISELCELCISELSTANFFEQYDACAVWNTFEVSKIDRSCHLFVIGFLKDQPHKLLFYLLAIVKMTYS